mgnify:CR=1 FL=1
MKCTCVAERVRDGRARDAVPEVGDERNGARILFWIQGLSQWRYYCIAITFVLPSYVSTKVQRTKVLPCLFSYENIPVRVRTCTVRVD